MSTSTVDYDFYTTPAKQGQIITATIASLHRPLKANREGDVYGLLSIPGHGCDGLLTARDIEQDFYEGQELEVLIVNPETDNGFALVSTQAVKTERSWDSAVLRQTEGQIVPMEVREATRGGLIGRVGNLEAFLPGSRALAKRFRHLQRYVGQTIEVVIVEVERARGNIIVDQIEARNQTREKEQAELAKVLTTGSVRKVTVTNITPHEVFASLGAGVTGRIPKRELSWKKNIKPADIVEQGQEFEVKVLGTQVRNGVLHVQLSRRALGLGPWQEAAQVFPPGTQAQGWVKFIHEKHGAFVRLQEYPDVVGLILPSQLKDNPVKPKSEVTIEIVAIDPDKERLRLKTV